MADRVGCGMMIPPVVFSSASTRRIRTRSCNGRKPILNLPSTFLITGISALIERAPASFVGWFVGVKQLPDRGGIRFRTPVWRAVVGNPANRSNERSAAGPRPATLAQAVNGSSTLKLSETAQAKVVRRGGAILRLRGAS
jgi:hypothetical protein